jgi:hypothetical protein
LKRKKLGKIRLLLTALFNFAEFHSVSFRVTEWTLPKY